MYKTLSPSRTGDRPNTVIAKPIARRNHKVFPCPCWWFSDFKNFPGQGMTLHCSPEFTPMGLALEELLGFCPSLPGSFQSHFWPRRGEEKLCPRSSGQGHEPTSF